MTRNINRRRSTVIITIVIILAVAIVTIFVFRAIYRNDQQDVPDNNESSSTITDTSSTNDSTGDTDVDTAEPDVTTDDTPLQYEGADPNTSTAIEAVLTYYGVQDGEYLVNVNIPQYLNGTCQITLGDYTGSVAIDQGAANSACSFRIPIKQLKAGLHSLEINIQSDAAQGTIKESIDVSL